MNIVILCGGIGSRLKAKTNGKPKILIPIGDKPFIYLLLDCLINNGFKKIFFLTSYKSDQIIREVGSFYRNIPIIYINDSKKLKPGTASALYGAIEKLPEHFLLQYGDTLLDLNYVDFYEKSLSLKDSLLMSIYSNKQNLDKNNVYFDNTKLLYFNTEDQRNLKKIFSANFIDYGLLGIKKSFIYKNIELLKGHHNLKSFQEKLSINNSIKPYIVIDRFYEVGTPKSYEECLDAYKIGKLNKIIN